MGCGGCENAVKGRMVDCSPGVTIVIKHNSRFVYEINVCGLVCDVEEGVHNICQFY